ncbi:MAG: isoleucyl-tRNA synthase [candidate division Zixibacteria bacterium SM23_73_2]|nr:MAG: isoleucyl-tRNA synthase [candidate division Zixibacteria bacterium SM23_73_2]
MEKEILSFWEKNKIFEKSISIRKDSPHFVFYEGPPTANGKPGIHHVISRTIKDLICRYKTMKGFRVDRKAGWDTHGLPVEIEVEKELGLKTKADIEKYGIAKFNTKCRESVFRYVKEWDELTKRMGYWLDLNDAYITCSNEYIESVWWSLSEYFKKGLIYQGYKIVPYCPRCGTALSSHEVAQGYEEVEDPSVFVKMELEDEKGTYFLVWTTTPWTLISNVALAFGSELIYAKVEYKGERLILAKALLDSVLKDDFKILEEFKGKKLEGKRYKPLYEFVKIDRSRAFYVTLADFVSLEEGTGIVHIAPAFGEDDYKLSRVYSLPLVQPVDEVGEFTQEVTPWQGMFVKDADPLILEDLKKRKLLFDSGKYLHTYPFCWRCESPLVYYARKSWYIKTTAYKDKLISSNRKINWQPPEIGTGRFGEWLEGNVDWALSRERFWGTPLNIWICESCGEKKTISSIKELGELAGRLPENLDLHKPMIDTITFKCPNCSGLMKRTPEVIDCWFDTGSMPFAQWHYPFENQDEFKSNFPSNFISEGVDQTRGWFYSLLAISVFLFEKSSYKNVIVIEMIQDKDGAKMSKSKGNVIDPWEVLDVQGADALRWYLISVSHPWFPTRVSKEAITEVGRKLLSTLRNSYTFFALYANIDDFDPSKYNSPVEKRPLIDRWLISRLNSLINKVNRSLDSYDVTRAARNMQDFLIEDLSNWYVRRNRRRYWGSGMEKDKVDAYLTLWETLLSLIKLLAPYIPFISEELYQQLSAKDQNGKKQSVHLDFYARAQDNLIDPDLEEGMEGIKRIASLGRAVRNKAKIKIRQPLEKLKVKLPYQKLKKKASDLFDLVKEEVNVKEVEVITDDSSLLTLRAHPNFSLLGPKLGEKAKKVAEKILTFSQDDLKKFRKEGKFSLKLEGEIYDLNSEEVAIGEEGKDGWVVESDFGYKVFLFVVLNEDLKDEGFARELVNKIQNMRKSAGFEVMDKITVDIKSSDRLNLAVDRYQEYIKKETLAQKITRTGKDGEYSGEWNINGEKAKLSVSRIIQEK